MKTLKKADTRNKRTQKLLSNALLSLLNSRSFDSISVIDICEEAEVSRATFYVHFKDKYDLLAYTQKNISEEFKFAEGDIEEHHLKLFKAAHKYNRFFSQLVSVDQNSIPSTAKKEMIDIMFKSIGHNNPSFSANLTAIAFASASEGILQWWFDQKDQSNMEELYNEVLKIFNWDYIKETLYQDNH
ncbi:TetR/AcrR family transcriptional regulator [Neobacillus niacini]|uniref:TetR/AcrR family transcriptional regulator n=1 Tax=Neobacillus niacini TaxID=86668 RepID=UPI002FFF4E98